MPTGTTHQLRFSAKSNLATCRCRNWSLTDLQQPLTEKAAKRNYELHKEMIKRHVRQEQAA